MPRASTDISWSKRLCLSFSKDKKIRVSPHQRSPQSVLYLCSEVFMLSMHTTAQTCLWTLRWQPSAFAAGLSSMLELGCLSGLALWDGIVHCGRSQYQPISALLAPASVIWRAISFCEHFPHIPLWSKQVSYLSPPHSCAGALVGRG